jgi:hypothetical protein
VTETVPVMLARLRAQRCLPGVANSAADAAAACGRAVRRAGAHVVLSWQDGLSPSASDQVPLRRLTPARAALLAVVLAQCWPDANDPIWPGEPTTRGRVLAAALQLGLDTKHAVGSLEVDFVDFGLIQAGGDEIRLGPAVAAWTPAEVESLRRVHARIRAAGR